MKDVHELAGEELDFWVANALGMVQVARMPDAANQSSMAPGEPEKGGARERFSPHQNPAHAYPIIERERISTRYVETGTGGWLACNLDSGHFAISSNSLLEAAMRCFVAMHYGHEVDDAWAAAVPESDPACLTQATDKPAQAHLPHAVAFTDCGQQDAWL